MRVTCPQFGGVNKHTLCAPTFDNTSTPKRAVSRRVFVLTVLLHHLKGTRLCSSWVFAGLAFHDKTVASNFLSRSAFLFRGKSLLPKSEEDLFLTNDEKLILLFVGCDGVFVAVSMPICHQRRSVRQNQSVWF